MTAETPRTEQLSPPPTKSEMLNSKLGWGTPFLKEGGLLWRLNELVAEVTGGQQIADGRRAVEFHNALETVVIGLERDLTAARSRVAELEKALRHAMQALVHQDGRLIDPDCEGCQQARALLSPSPQCNCAPFDNVGGAHYASCPAASSEVKP